MYQYTGCGLDNVRLKNGYTIVETDYGPGVTIDDLEGLHRAIAFAIAHNNQPLSPDEFKFLRSELDLSQKRLGDLWDVSDQTIANYEKGKTIPRVYGGALRWLYLESVNEESHVSQYLTDLVDLDNQLADLHLELEFLDDELKGWMPFLQCA